MLLLYSGCSVVELINSEIQFHFEFAPERQSKLHPLSSFEPSSHFSKPAIIPSPQTVEQLLGDELQAHPNSI